MPFQVFQPVEVCWELMKTVDSKTCGDFLGRAALYDVEAKGIDFPFPKLFGKLANATIKKTLKHFMQTV